MADNAPFYQPIDFSILGDLPKTYAEGQARSREDALRQALSGGLPRGPGGVIDYGAAVDLAARTGNVGAIAPFAGLVNAQTQQAHAAAALAETKRLHDILAQQHSPEAQARVKEAIAQVEAKYAPKTTEITLPSGDKVTAEKSEQGYRLPKVQGLDQAAMGANPYAAPGAGMKEHEGKSALFADRAATSHETINKFENINQQPGGTIGATVERFLHPDAANILVSGERGQLMDAKRAFINALLRRESGAAIASSEFSSYDKEYFPRIGDTQEQIDNKRKHRAEVIKGLAREAGRGYKPGFTLDETTGAITKGAPQAAVNPDIADARRAIASGKISRAEAEKRLLAAGIKFDPKVLD